MNLNDISISNLNSSSEDDISKQTLNFCKAILFSHNKISITAHLSNPDYCTLNSDLVPIRYDDPAQPSYYGASPQINSDLIIGAISEFAFQSTIRLNNFIKFYHQHFMLHKGQEGYLLDFSKLILLTIASKFGIKLKSCPPLLEKLSPTPGLVSIQKEEGAIYLHGCPTQEILDALLDFRFKQEDGSELWTLSPTGCSLEDIYRTKQNIKLLVGKVFYSGVLLKARKIEKLGLNYENFDVENVKIQYERSTFATVCAMDDCLILHPLLADSKSNLENMFRLDDAAKAELARKLSYKALDEAEILTAVNAYLEESFNVNQIGVSGNAKTSDGKLFFGQRQTGNIDGGYLYPGINGNAEVYDPNVSFYQCSVYEDRPSIFAEHESDDFLGEIAREAYGELNLLTRKESWRCHGVIISGNLPKETPGSSRRCHLNILFETEIEIPFEQIKQQKETAVEAFENARFLAVKILYYPTLLHHLADFTASLLHNLVNSKDFIESLLLISIAIYNVDLSYLSFHDPLSLASTIFTFLLLLTGIADLSMFLKSYYISCKETKTIYIYKKTSYPEVCRKLSKLMGKRYHPAAYMALKTHVDNLLYHELKQDK